MKNEKQINVNMADTKPVYCKNCNNDTFKQLLMLRSVPGLLIGQKDPTLQMFPLLACAKCEHIVNPEYYEMKKMDAPKTN